MICFTTKLTPLLHETSQINPKNRVLSGSVNNEPIDDKNTTVRNGDRIRRDAIFVAGQREYKKRERALAYKSHRVR